MAQVVVSTPEALRIEAEIEAARAGDTYFGRMLIERIAECLEAGPTLPEPLRWYLVGALRQITPKEAAETATIGLDELDRLEKRFDEQGLAALFSDESKVVARRRRGARLSELRDRLRAKFRKPCDDARRAFNLYLRRGDARTPSEQRDEAFQVGALVFGEWDRQKRVGANHSIAQCVETVAQGLGYISEGQDYGEHRVAKGYESYRKRMARFQPWLPEIDR